MTNSLGRGLESLIPKKDNQEKSHQPGGHIPEKEKYSEAGEGGRRRESVFNIEVEKIKPNPLQPRKEIKEDDLEDLASSVKHYGILQPVIVSKVQRKVARGTETNYVLLAGERRWRAARKVGLEIIPAIVREATPQERLEIALVENIQRADLNSIEEAKAFRHLIEDLNVSQKDLAAHLGRSQESLSNAVRLLELPAEIQTDVMEGKISTGHARALLAVKNQEKQRALREKVVSEKLSVRKTEDISRVLSGKKEAPREQKPRTIKGAAAKNPQLASIEKELQEILDARVGAYPRGEEGTRLAIDLFTKEDMEGFMEKMRGLK